MERYNKTIGKFGEEKAAKYLSQKGYQILEKNYNTKLGEIDIVAKDGKVLVFCEVKTRTNLSHGDPKDAINYYKKKHIINTARFYMESKDLYDTPARFDVIEVLIDREKLFHKVKINHLKDAFFCHDV